MAAQASGRRPAWHAPGLPLLCWVVLSCSTYMYKFWNRPAGGRADLQHIPMLAIKDGAASGGKVHAHALRLARQLRMSTACAQQPRMMHGGPTHQRWGRSCSTPGLGDGNSSRHLRSLQVLQMSPSLLSCAHLRLNCSLVLYQCATGCLCCWLTRSAGDDCHPAP